MKQKLLAIAISTSFATIAANATMIEDTNKMEVTNGLTKAIPASTAKAEKRKANPKADKTNVKESVEAKAAKKEALEQDMKDMPKEMQKEVKKELLKLK